MKHDINEADDEQDTSDSKTVFIGQPLSAGDGSTTKPLARTSEGQTVDMLLLVHCVVRKKVLAAGGASGDVCSDSLSMLGHRTL